MRILHTSDWHLGKLDGMSRLEEQELFVNDFIKILDKENINMVIVAGDIYDTSNPSAEAEKLFYKSLKGMTNNGKRIVVLVSGNHDNPDRMAAANPLAFEQGVILVPYPKTTVQTGICGSHKIVGSGEGFFEVEINGERAVIVAVPYPSEKRLNEIIFTETCDDENCNSEISMQKNYSTRLGELFSMLEENFREDTINVVVSHIYVSGSEESDSERKIQLGGSMSVNICDLPKKAQYVALGHLHRPQEVKNAMVKTLYSGSPLQYSKSEIGYSKSGYVVELSPKKEPVINRVLYNNFKPIEIWKASSINDAIELCERNKERNVWAYLEINTESYINYEDIKRIKSIKKDILEIRPIITNEVVEKEMYSSLRQKSISEMFKLFYKKNREVEPTNELMELFMSIVEGGDVTDETHTT